MLALIKSNIVSPVTLSAVYSTATRPVVHIAESALILFPLSRSLNDTGVSPRKAHPTYVYCFYDLNQSHLRIQTFPDEIRDTVT